MANTPDLSVPVEGEAHVIYLAIECRWLLTP